MINVPTVSIIMATYNHAEYITHTIKSVLAQNFLDFEFIITNDGSTDDTIDQISKFNDPRIKYFSLDYNQGEYAALYNSYKHSKGKYIAVINSDDAWHSTKLAKQVDFMDNNIDYGACFTHATFKDHNLCDFSNENRSTVYNLFYQSNKSSPLWLHQFFFEGNSLCHPSLLIRNECFKKLGFYYNHLKQLPDFEMWIRLIKNYKIHIIEESLVDFRWMGERNSCSFVPITNRTRFKFETKLLLEEILNNINISFFKEAFEKYLINKDFSSILEFEIEKAFLYLNRDDDNKIIAIEKLYYLMKHKEYKDILLEKYNFNDKNFIKLSGEIGTLKIKSDNGFTLKKILELLFSKFSNLNKIRFFVMLYKKIINKICKIL